MIQDERRFQHVPKPEASLGGAMVERQKPHLIVRRARAVPATLIVWGVCGDSRGRLIADCHRRRSSSFGGRISDYGKTTCSQQSQSGDAGNLPHFENWGNIAARLAEAGWVRQRLDFVKASRSARCPRGVLLGYPSEDAVSARIRRISIISGQCGVIMAILPDA